MTSIKLGPTGFTLDVVADGSHLDDAAELEQLGYSTIWLPGGQLDSLDRIAEIVRATTTVQVAPSIIPPDVYSSAAVATLYAELEGSDPGRFVVGLGGPQQRRSMSALNAYLDRLDTADPPVPVGRRILAAIGPRKLQLARDRFGGAVPLLVTPQYTADARQILGTDSTLVISQPVVLDRNPESARRTARGMLSFLLGGTIPGYVAAMLRMGFSQNDVDQLADRLVDAVVVWGDEDAIAARIDEHRRAGADQVALSVLTAAGGPTPIEVARRLASSMHPVG